MTRHAEVATSDVVKRVIPALAELAGRSATRPVRNRGTHRRLDQQQRSGRRLSGRGRWRLNATVRTNKREITADDFFKGMFETALEPDEIVTAVHFPQARQGRLREVPATRPRATPWSACSSPGPAAGVRVAVTGAGPTVFRANDDGASAGQNFSPAALDSITVTRRRPQQRHPRQRGVPRPPRQGHGQARGRGAGVEDQVGRGLDPLPRPPCVVRFRSRPAPSYGGASFRRMMPVWPLSSTIPTPAAWCTS